MIKQFDKEANRKRKHAKIRHNLYGTPSKPRVSVYRSNKHIYAQVIDDLHQNTLISASTLDPELDLDAKVSTSSIEAAEAVGELLGKKANEANIDKVVFDRSGYIYHGRVAAIAEGLREAGLSL